MNMKTECPYCKTDNITKIANINGQDRYRCNNINCIVKTESGNNKTFYIGQKGKMRCPRCDSIAARIGKINRKQRFQCKECKKTFFEKVEEPIDPVEAKLEEWRKEGKPVDLMELGMLVHVDDNEHVTEQNPTIDNEDAQINNEEFEKWKLKEEEEDEIKAKELSTLKNKKLELEKKYFGESEEDVI